MRRPFWRKTRAASRIGRANASDLAPVRILIVVGDNVSVSHSESITGRFAPSPTGPLHFGSLVAAVGSYLDARSRNGRWLVRMEDLDTPRIVRGADTDILQTLEEFGFEWDGPVLYQSTRGEAYRAALDQLRNAGMLFPCGCSRREIADSQLPAHGAGGVRYPGTCREGLPTGRTAKAWRVRVSEITVAFTDRVQGVQQQQLADEVGDFVLWRADGLFAYQLAVVLDDAAQGVTDVVRGADLLDSTPRQIYLQRLLGLPTPAYLHLPVALNEEGQKLSKQTRAPALNRKDAVSELVKALRFLGQTVPREFTSMSCKEVWNWAVSHWNVADIPANAAVIR